MYRLWGIPFGPIKGFHVAAPIFPKGDLDCGKIEQVDQTPDLLEIKSMSNCCVTSVTYHGKNEISI
jgi:hypothetical protein